MPEVVETTTVDAPGTEMTFSQFEASRQGGTALPEIEETPAPTEEEGKIPEATETPETERDEHGKFKPKESDVPPGVQKRIDKAVAKQREAERRAEEAERKLAETAAKPAEVKEAAKESAEAKPDVSKYTTYEDYIEALTDWKARQVLASARKADAEAAAKAKEQEERETVLTDWEQSELASKEAHEDYQEALDAASDIKLSPELQAAIMLSDSKTELAYYLATNREELERLAAVPTYRIGYELGKLEGKIDAPASEPVHKEKRTAPKPPSPVGSRATSNSSDPRTAETFEDFVNRRNAQLYKK